VAKPRHLQPLKSPADALALDQKESHNPKVDLTGEVVREPGSATALSSPLGVSDFEESFHVCFKECEKVTCGSFEAFDEVELRLGNKKSLASERWDRSGTNELLCLQ